MTASWRGTSQYNGNNTWDTVGISWEYIYIYVLIYIYINIYIYICTYTLFYIMYNIIQNVHMFISWNTIIHMYYLFLYVLLCYVMSLLAIINLLEHTHIYIYMLVYVIIYYFYVIICHYMLLYIIMYCRIYLWGCTMVSINGDTTGFFFNGIHNNIISETFVASAEITNCLYRFIVFCRYITLSYVFCCPFRSLFYQKYDRHVVGAQKAICFPKYIHYITLI